MNQNKTEANKEQRPTDVASGAVLGHAELALLEYLHQQFPATIGHIPLAEKIHAVWQKGMNDAADIVRDRRIALEKNNCKDPIREHYAEYEIRYASHDEGVLLDDGGNSGSW